MLEESGLPYRIVLVHIGDGAQFAPDFLAISPNNRIPAIADHAPAGGGAPLAPVESGAILQYMAEKTGRFLPGDAAGRCRVLQWPLLAVLAARRARPHGRAERPFPAVCAGGIPYAG